MLRHLACQITPVETLGAEEGDTMEDLEETEEEVEDTEMMVIVLITSEAIIEDSEVREN